jgi:hypothetical protein
MSGKRVRLVAAQVVVVGGLLLVVYLTLLQPEEHKPLFGVGVPAGPGHVADTGGGEREGGAHGGGHGARGHRGGGKPPGATGAVSAAAASEPTGLPVPAREGGNEGGAVTPSEEQYGDTVSRLFGNL